jgi:hypothetical protein
MDYWIDGLVAAGTKQRPVGSAGLIRLRESSIDEMTGSNAARKTETPQQ